LTKLIDLKGKRFGRLVVLKKGIKTTYGEYKWLCKCDCGKEKEIPGSCLRRKNGTKSCGCIWSEDLTGKKFNHLTAIKYIGKTKFGGKIYLWKCDCGTEKEIEAANVKSGHIIACGCKIGSHPPKDITGKRFGLLIAKKVAKSDKDGAWWYCDCDCGRKNVVFRGSSLRSGKNIHCGCRKSHLLIGKKFGKLTVISIESIGTGKKTKNYAICKCDCGKDYKIKIPDIKYRKSCGCLVKKDVIGKKFNKLIITKTFIENGIHYCLCDCDCGTKNHKTWKYSVMSGDVKSCGCIRRNDLVGKRFGKLTVKSYAGVENNKVLWLCKCDCGRNVKIHSGALTSGNTKTCGCSHIRNLKGVKIGRLTGIKIVAQTIIGKNNIWLCKCDCGNTCLIQATNFGKGTNSCGCLKRKDISGKRFGKLVAKYSIELKNNKVFWSCDCDCGKKNIKLPISALTSGNTKSCGCLLKEYYPLGVNKKIQNSEKNKMQIKIGNKYNLNWEESARIVEKTTTINF